VLQRRPLVLIALAAGLSAVGQPIASAQVLSPQPRRAAKWTAEVYAGAVMSRRQQFSTIAGDRSSLTGSIAGLNTFTGSGLDTRILLTVGYFVRIEPRRML
jgi:hypothetical protein